MMSRHCLVSDWAEMLFWALIFWAIHISWCVFSLVPSPSTLCFTYPVDFTSPFLILNHPQMQMKSFKDDTGRRFFMKPQDLCPAGLFLQRLMRAPPLWKQLEAELRTENCPHRLFSSARVGSLPWEGQVAGMSHKRRFLPKSCCSHWEHPWTEPSNGKMLLQVATEPDPTATRSW